MKQTVLIAESDSELCGIYRRFLSDCGFAVESTSDGLTCLATLRQLKPDVLVLDQELCWGGADGVLAWLREERSQSEVAVILTVTASSFPETVQDGEPPVVRFLGKPFALTALLESVQAIVGTKKQAEPRIGRDRCVALPELSLG